jgi:hypothetical protein
MAGAVSSDAQIAAAYENLFMLPPKRCNTRE